MNNHEVLILNNNELFKCGSTISVHVFENWVFELAGDSKALTTGDNLTFAKLELVETLNKTLLPLGRWLRYDRLLGQYRILRPSEMANEAAIKERKARRHLSTANKLRERAAIELVDADTTLVSNELKLKSIETKTKRLLSIK